ncbi:beta clamp domain-containing protein [Lapidilactobacillus bayanensis]|uniref:hypothetical protein n=1 Tax=Lapidilactobacillus bayanensis TaxID=2485998 RepID=UPI000F7A33DF|nr:hypothetical protein [Lapidilactobacillus bayanensis]
MMKDGQLEKAFKAITKKAAKSRPVLGCLHVNTDGSAVVTDSHRLLQIKHWAEEGTSEMTLDLQTFKPQTAVDYPDTSRIIPTKFLCTLKVEVRELASLSEMLKIKTDKGLVQLGFTGEDSRLQVVAETLTTTIPVAKFDGLTGFDITMNAKYLFDAVEFFKAYNDKRPQEQITLGFSGDIRPMVLKQEDATYVICPVRTF